MIRGNNINVSSRMFRPSGSIVLPFSIKKASLALRMVSRLGHKKTKLDICHHNYAHVVHTTAKQVISRRRKNARAKRAKILFFIVKYANLWGFCCRRRRGCLSSLLLACIQDEILGRTKRAKSKGYRNIFANCKMYDHFCFLLSLFINYYRIHQ